MSGLMKENQLLTSASAFNVFQNVVLVQRYEDNLTSHRPVAGKWSLTAIQIRQIFFDIRPKLTKWSFLFVLSSPNDMFIDFREKGRERETMRGRLL